MKTKKHLLKFLIVFLLLPVVSTAQQYQPIPDSNAAWIIEQDDGWGNLFTHRFSLSPFIDDTIINSISYTKLFFRFDNGYFRYHGAYRNENNGKSYYVPAYEQQEYLLRDFSMNTGDTIKDVAYEFVWDWTWILDFIVDSTEWVISGPYSYKIMYLSTVVKDTIPEQGSDPLVWIEKIGSFGGGILNAHRGGLSAKRLYCMQYNDTIYYDSYLWAFRKQDIVYENGECSDPVGVKETESDKLDIQITPNPFSTQFTLENLPENEQMELVLLNSFGQVVFRKSLTGEQPQQQITINQALAKGLYILKIYTDKQLLFTQKVIKQ